MDVFWTIFFSPRADWESTSMKGGEGLQNSKQKRTGGGSNACTSLRSEKHNG